MSDGNRQQAAGIRAMLYSSLRANVFDVKSLNARRKSDGTWRCVYSLDKNKAAEVQTVQSMCWQRDNIRKSCLLSAQTHLIGFQVSKIRADI